MRAAVLACVLVGGCEAVVSTDSVTHIRLDGAPGDAGIDLDEGVPAPDGAPDPDAGREGDAAIGVEADGAAADPDAAEIEADAAPPPGDPRGRTPEQVCAHWRGNHVATQGPDQVPDDPNDACDHGTVPDAAQQNGIRRTNLYRWLAGLDPVVLEPGLRAQQQACAAVLVGMGGLSHQPPAGAPCYTPEGAQGAGSSNLAAGARLADTVDLYVGDNGVASLGHRRWVLNPGARVTTFGHKGRFGCMYSFSQGAPVGVDFVSWPPPGPVPTAAAPGPFHVSLYRLRPANGFSIEVRVDDGPFEAVQLTPLAGGFGGGVPAYIFGLPAGESVRGVWVAGREVGVRLRGLRDHADVTYTTRFVGCR